MTAACSPSTLDAYLDGLLDAEAARAFEAHAAECAGCASEIALAERIRATLRETPAEPCPDEVFDAALARIAALERDRPALRPARLPRPSLVRRVALAAVLAVAVGLGVLPFFTAPEPPAPYSAEEVAEARRQIEYALGLVGDAGRETGLFLEQDVLGGHVVAPLNRNLRLNP